MTHVEQLTVIFLGPQGSGKGTQVQLLKEYLNEKDPGSVLYFTAGTNLRSFAVGEGYTQERIRPLIAGGKLIPTFITTSLFSARLIGGMHGEEHIILDGFPRTVDQTPDLHSAMQFYDRKNIAVLHIGLSDDVARQRLAGRGREDDTKEGIEERLRWSHEEAAAVNEWFKAHPDYRYIEINGDQTIQQVHTDVLKALNLGRA
ncbi:MAG: adenylate kinase [Patescibacteria group bacterium]|nr:adenylate kinase [Patescibacteria group bacterium]